MHGISPFEAIGLGVSLLAIGCLMPMIWRSGKLSAWLGLLLACVGVFTLGIHGAFFGSATIGTDDPASNEIALWRMMEIVGVLSAALGFVALSVIADRSHRDRAFDRTLVRVEDGLALSQTTLAALLDSTADLILLVRLDSGDDADADLEIECARVSDAARRTQLAGAVHAQRIGDILPEHLRDTVRRLVGQTLDSGTPTSGHSGSIDAGSMLDVWVVAIDSIALVRVCDITDRAATERELRRRAFTDTLTGLANRRRFEERLACLPQPPRGEDRIALAYLDLNGFKEVNDAYGHKSGDAILAAFADRLRSTLDEHVPGPAVGEAARIGGDEFVVLVTGLDDERVAALADALHDELARPYSIRGREIRCDASIGVVGFTPKIGSTSALLEHADAAMYAAKFGQGRTLSVRLGRDGDAVQRRRKSDWHIEQPPPSSARGA
ncbi:MAG: GGDEF domain-containing protein [Planctomycetota bacterium]